MSNLTVRCSTATGIDGEKYIKLSRQNINYMLVNLIASAGWEADKYDTGIHDFLMTLRKFLTEPKDLIRKEREDG